MQMQYKNKAQNFTKNSTHRQVFFEQTFLEFYW